MFEEKYPVFADKFLGYMRSKTCIVVNPARFFLCWKISWYLSHSLHTCMMTAVSRSSVTLLLPSWHVYLASSSRFVTLSNISTSMGSLIHYNGQMENNPVSCWKCPLTELKRLYLERAFHWLWGYRTWDSPKQKLLMTDSSVHPLPWDR